ncbi:protein ZGRF1 [Pezoporus flaviventris]|uniref:protein ZGRF1 n=1 Tax=Pezoporus flaviventris TaxID=889875 RepID=UPI002AAFC037|nr:protein ZGRF1 [Pezoporus flaviventris]
MPSQEFTVLYTHQKMKKSKTWQDGILKIRNGSNKAVLFDDKGQCLESIFIKSQVNAGDDLESERYLITVEAVKVNENSFEDQPREAETPAVDRNGVKPGVPLPRHLSVGLKRMFTSFRGPRQVEKIRSTMEEGEKTTLPLSKQSEGAFPSNVYGTSPLFCTICQKDAETSGSADFHEDTCIGNNSKHMSLPSLLSAPFLDRCEEAEKQNPDRSIMRPESPVITGHTKSSSQRGVHEAVSHSIRSTAQILALLKSKPAQRCRQQTTSQGTECLSRFQASENTDSLYKRKNTILSTFSGKPAKRLMENIQHLPCTKGTAYDNKECNADMLLNLAGQPCDKDVTGQRLDKKTNNLSQDLQDSCSTNSCFLPESTISRVSDSQFASSSGDILCSASRITLEKNLSRYKEHLGSNNLEENSSMKLQSAFQPKQASERSLELSADLILTGIGTVKEELSMHSEGCPDELVMEANFNLLEAFDFNDTDNEDLCERAQNTLTEGDNLSQSPDCLRGGDVAQNAALRLHSCCEVATHSKNEELTCSAFNRQNDGNHYTGGITSQLCDSDVIDTGRIAEDSENQTRIAVELLGDGHDIKEINERELSIEATIDKKDPDGCAVHTINGTSWMKSKQPDLSLGDTNVNECHPKTSMFEKAESISGVSTSRIISAMDKNTEKDVIQPGCLKCPDVDLEHFCGTESDDVKADSPLLALPQKPDPSCASFQYIAENPQKVFVIPHKEDSLISRSSTCPLEKSHSSPEETAVSETELENVESINAFHEACKGEQLGMDCRKCPAMADNSSVLHLVNNITLLGALTQHSTALESLEKMAESNSMLYEAETSKEIFEPLVKDEAIKQFTEMPYSESIKASSHLDSSGLMPNHVLNLLQKKASILPTSSYQREPETPDCQPKAVVFQGHQVRGSAASEIMSRASCSQLGGQHYPGNMEFAAERFLSPLFSSNDVFSDFRQSPGSGSLHGNTNFTGEEDFQKKPNITEESKPDQFSLALNMCSELPTWTMSGSPSLSDLRQTQRTSWKPSKMISSVQMTSSLDSDPPVSPASGSEESIGGIQEPLRHRILPSGLELSDFIFTQEKSSHPEECNLSRVKPPVERRTPFVTLPATEKILDTVYSTDSEEALQPFGSSVVNLCSKSEVFPISAFGPEDRNYETSVFGEYKEKRQRECVQPVSPNVTSQYKKSKWLKYQNSAQCDLTTVNSDGREVTDDICAENLLGMLPSDTGECSIVNKSAPHSAALLTAKSALGKCSANTSHRDLISERKLLSPQFSQTPLTEATQKVLSHLSCHTATGASQDISICELSFPHVDKVKHANLPKRKTFIPAMFQSHVQYKQIFKAALTEQLNIMLFELSQRFYNALSKVDISFYTSLKDEQTESKESCVPLCHHMHPAKLVMAKKEGQNKSHLFYTCDAPKAEQCSFFKWIEDVNPTQTKSRPSIVLLDIKSIGTYLRSQKISLYEECQLLVRKGFEIQTQPCKKFKKLMNTPARFDGDSKTKLYLKLSRKEHYSFYSKDDIWVVSKTLNFDPLDTFIATSTFFGPSSTNEIELLPLKGYCPSNWRSNMFVHALLVCNASGELASLRNMEEHFNPSTLPLTPYLLKMNFDFENATNRVEKSKFTPPALSLKHTMNGPVSTEVAMGLAKKIIQTFSLNPDQATSLLHIAQMMTSCENTKPMQERQIFPITLIRGGFGAGKTYLLSVVILFLVQLFESSEAMESSRLPPWKVLIASSTNTAVDRILLCLLSLGFEDFIRVGSVRKITKAILPHSLHVGSINENDQLKELLALMKEDLTPAEKIYVRKSIEQHKLGTNKTILQQVKVVGVTCAACPFPCLNSLQFPVVILDECSQMTEPASLLPIARFQCEKLVIVGDPKQLPPPIQGSESAHEKGLEQTLFDRLCLMGHKAIVLRTQYRCHPAISAIANDLFYDGSLTDGISEEDRSPLLDWLPTLCFYNVNGVEQIERDNSFYNMPEAHFTVKLTQALIASGIEGSAVGVITLYKSQMCKIQNLLCGVRTELSKIKAVQVSTVDAFQGSEKEIIVLSCVRTRQIGFIDSEKRMNVALTRARRHLLIIGNLPCLSRNRLWGRVIHHCKEWENGLQHVSQCEQWLNDILKSYWENQKEEKQSKKEK